PRSGGLLDGGGGPPQGRSDLVDLDLDDRATIALFGLPRPLLEPPGDDHTGALLERLGDCLGLFAPAGPGEEAGVLLPFPGLTISPAPVDSDPDLGHGHPRGSETEFGVVDQVADEGHVVGHLGVSFPGRSAPTMPQGPDFVHRFGQEALTILCRTTSSASAKTRSRSSIASCSAWNFTTE